MKLLDRPARLVARALSKVRSQEHGGKPVVRYPFREVMAAIPATRPPYFWGVLCAASLGKALGFPRISVIEFGVAGGNGLVELERLAGIVEQLVGIGIDVYGFDTGTGLPKPTDYRDLPNLWGEGDYRMDEAKLRARLAKAQLRLGPVSKTVPDFLKEANAPVGFVSFDLDMYSSTMAAFELFRGAAAVLLPRVTCYFDDILGFSFGDHNGERLAIADFNGANERRKLSRIYGLRYMVGSDRGWTETMYMLHAFDSPRYNDFDGTNPHLVRQLPLA